jgi:hypothetical protein
VEHSSNPSSGTGTNVVNFGNIFAEINWRVDSYVMLFMPKLDNNTGFQEKTVIFPNQFAMELKILLFYAKRVTLFKKNATSPI